MGGDEEKLVEFTDGLSRIDDCTRALGPKEQVFASVLDEMLTLFEADRALLLSPLDSSFERYRIEAESHRPKWPGPTEIVGIELPLEDDEQRLLKRAALQKLPVFCGPGSTEVTTKARGYGVKAQILVATAPRVGSTWMVVLHRCEHGGGWSVSQQRLLLAIAARVGDAIAHRLLEDQLRLSEERMRSIFEHDNRPLVVFDGETRTLVDSNPKAHDLFGLGREDLLSRSVDSLSVEVRPPDPPQNLSAHLAQADRDGVTDFPWLCLGPEGEVLHTQINLVPLRVDGRRLYRASIEDLSESLRLEEGLKRAQRLESLGMLAGGVAHDFNNLLVVIGAHSEFLADESADENILAHVQSIQGAADRAAALTRQLLAFGRQQVLTPRSQDLRVVAQEVRELLRRVLGEHIELSVDVGTEPLRATVDSGRLEQAIINFCTNARDAMPQGGRLLIRCETFHCDAEMAQVEKLPRGAYASIVVQDSGAGMPPEVRKHVFEPFFTTKPAGKGTGLGLATAYGFARQSGGTVLVDSVPQEGTSVRILLPLSGAPVQELSAGRTMASGEGDATILVVDDDRTVVQVISRALKRRGYQVLSEGSGEAALELFQQPSPPRVDLLISDVVMPRINGAQLARHLRELSPGLRVLFVSGYPANILDEIADLGPVELLSKPFTPRELYQKVSEVLSSSEQG